MPLAFLKNPKLLLSIWMYLGWFGCVYFGKNGWDLASLFFPLVAWLLLWAGYGLDRRLVLRLSALLFTGLIFDSLALYCNLIAVTPALEFGWMPLWLLSLWLLFITSIPLFQSLLQKKYFFSALLGAIFGPLSYKSGAGFGVLQMNGMAVIFIYALFWALYMPAAIYWLGRDKTAQE